MKSINDKIINKYNTFIVATQAHFAQLDAAPMGLPIRWHIDPLRAAFGPFLHALQVLDRLTFGPKGMPMDKWIFFAGAELPGFIYGFAIPVEELSDDEKSLLEVPDAYRGPVPISMYIAIPMFESGAWFGHNLASLNRLLPQRGLRYLATMTKTLGLAAYKTRECYGATQWNSQSIGVHTRFGPLDLLTAYTPAHSFAETLSYHVSVDAQVLRAAMGDPQVQLPRRPRADFYIHADRPEEMIALQKRIEAGARFQICDRPAQVGAQAVYPIAELP